MKLLLITPPLCDPTLPALGCATLAACVRSEGRHIVAQADLNIRLLNRLLTRETLESCISYISAGGGYDSAWLASASETLHRLAPGAVDDAKSVLRDPVRFYNSVSYRMATDTLDIAYAIVSESIRPWKLIREFNGMVREDRSPRTLADYQDDQMMFADMGFNPVRDILNGVIDGAMAQHEPDIVGVSQVYDSQAFLSCYITLRVRKKWPSAKIVIGGTSLTEHVDRVNTNLGSALKYVFGDPDFLIPGEGEIALPSLLDALEGTKAFKSVPNLIYVDKASGCTKQNPRARQTDLDAIPPPLFATEDLTEYWSPEPVVSFAPTRGCYWDRCTFCAYGLREGDRATAPYREMTASILTEQLMSVQEQSGARHFIFGVDVIRPAAMELYAEHLRRASLDITWQAETRPERSLLKPGRLAVMRKGGLRHLSFGIESWSQEVLNAMDKGTDVATFIPLLEEMKRNEIASDLMLFRGFPAETDAQLQETIKFLKENEPLISRPVSLGVFHLIDGCRVEKKSDTYQIRVNREDALNAAFRPSSYAWTSVVQSAKNGRDTSDTLEREIRALGTRIGRRPWVGATGAAHTFLYFANRGIDSVRKYNAFVHAIQERLLVEVFNA